MTQGHTGRDALCVPGYTEDEFHRLTDQGQLVASSTRALLLEAGIGPGMRVLDVGCGPGDVSLLAAQRVGPTGEVVGLDINDRVLELARARAAASGATQVRFIQTDLREFPVDRPFDAVVGRFVLMYLAAPADVVRRVVHHVGPGGIVAFQDFQIEHTRLASARVPLWEQWCSWIVALYPRSGVETNMGLRLRQTFLDAGLPAPRVHMDACLACRATRWWPIRAECFVAYARTHRSAQLCCRPAGTSDTSATETRRRGLPAEDLDPYLIAARCPRQQVRSYPHPGWSGRQPLLVRLAH